MSNSVRSSRSMRSLRAGIASVLVIAFAVVEIPNALAVAAPTITTISEVASGGTAAVTVNFTRGDATTLTGIQYSTDGGTTWSECDSSKCNFTTSNNYVVLQKKSNENFAMRVGSTYQIILKACASGSAGNASSTNPASLGLGTCSASSGTVAYLVGTGIVSGVPTISTSSTIAHGAVNPSITISGTNFDTTTALAKFNIDPGTTGLTASTATWNSASSVTFSFTGTAKAGTVSISAKTNAYAPAESAASNSVDVVVPTSTPETATALSGTVASSTQINLTWSAPSYDGGSTITEYGLEYTTETVTLTSWIAVSPAPTGLSKSLSGLTASTSYVFRVRAKNTNGYGPYTAASSVYTTQAPSSSPPAPQPEPIYPPTITGVSKAKICARGDEQIQIQGTNLKDAAVTIDGVPFTVKGGSSNVIIVNFGETTDGLKRIKVTNSAGSATYDLYFKMVDRTSFKVFDIPYIYQGGSFLYKFEAFGENTFRITGKLPNGLVLNAETGEISGIPTEQGVFNFVLHADGLCGNDVDVIHLDIDKEIPNAISYRIKFPNPKSKKIAGTAKYQLTQFLKYIKQISPKQIDPVIYISGGTPEGEAEVDSPEAKERRDSLCDVLTTQDLIAQLTYGIFDGDEDVMEIFVYWPVVR